MLLVGAGAAGVMAVRRDPQPGELELDVRGFVDDDPLKQGAVIAGVKVLGSCDDLSRPRARARDRPGDHHDRRHPGRPDEADPRHLRAVPVRVQTIPAFYDLLQGKVEISRFRDVRVEELLERDRSGSTSPTSWASWAARW